MKQKILFTFIESGFGHISSMQSIYDALAEEYSDKYDIEKSFIMTDDGFPNLVKMDRFIIKQVQNTNKIPLFGKWIFPIIHLLGGHHVMRFFHRQMATKSFKQGLEALKRRSPDVIVTNHYYTDLLAVEYKRRIDPHVAVVNYNPDPTLHSFWDSRGGVFIVNNESALKYALKHGFKDENTRLVTPCVRRSVETNTLSREQLREKYGLPQDRFTVVVADGGYMLGRGPKFARALIKSGLPITLCIIAGHNQKRYKEFTDIAEGKKRLKVADGMTLKVYEFVKEAYELYGAADVFLTKGGPNAVLDSIYMHTPVIIDYCPHLIESCTAKIYAKQLGCGETAFNKRKAVKRIKALMEDKDTLELYGEHINELIARGNGAGAVAAIIDEEAQKRLAELETASADTGDK
ncbi:MAG: hypothetical protein NC184_04015 [Roseburia sp.]|nr:hypothetical protein [Roseburia sp.]